VRRRIVFALSERRSFPETWLPRVGSTVFVNKKLRWMSAWRQLRPVAGGQFSAPSSARPHLPPVRPGSKGGAILVGHRQSESCPQDSQPYNRYERVASQLTSRSSHDPRQHAQPRTGRRMRSRLPFPFMILCPKKEGGEGEAVHRLDIEYDLRPSPRQFIEK
jgi:hypothetical protein